MDRYIFIKKVGAGSFGTVWAALNQDTGELVAIKKLKTKYYSQEECLNLNEVKILRKMKHPNIIQLKQVIKRDEILYLIFEYMDCSLHQLINSRLQYFTEDEIRKICFQLFQALAYMHHHGYFHRDLKPENVLVKGDIIKIGDLGSSREIFSRPPYTEYVTTRWYRAPEVLLHSRNYGSAVDMWAMGAIMAELFMFFPLFPGLSEVDQMFKICRLIGSPNQNSWAEGIEFASEMKYQFPQCKGVLDLSSVIPLASEDAINLITSLCRWDPKKRLTSAEALHHPFFWKSYFYVSPSLHHHHSCNEQIRTETNGLMPNSIINGDVNLDLGDNKKDDSSEEEIDGEMAKMLLGSIWDHVTK